MTGEEIEIRLKELRQEEIRLMKEKTILDNADYLRVLRKDIVEKIKSKETVAFTFNNRFHIGVLDSTYETLNFNGLVIEYNVDFDDSDEPYNYTIRDISIDFVYVDPEKIRFIQEESSELYISLKQQVKEFNDYFNV